MYKKLYKDVEGLNNKLKVSQFLTKYGNSCLTVQNTDSILAASLAFSTAIDGRKFSMAVVLDEHALVCGVLSLGDIVYSLHQNNGVITHLTVADIMSTEIVTAHVDDDIIKILDLMTETRKRHVPVVENGVLKGLILRKDALEALVDEALDEVKMLSEYVFRSGARY